MFFINHSYLKTKKGLTTPWHHVSSVDILGRRTSCVAHLSKWSRPMGWTNEDNTKVNLYSNSRNRKYYSFFKIWLVFLNLEKPKSGHGSKSWTKPFLEVRARVTNVIRLCCCRVVSPILSTHNIQRIKRGSPMRTRWAPNQPKKSN